MDLDSLSPFYKAQRVLFQPILVNNPTAKSSSYSSFSAKPRTLGYFYGHVNSTSLVGLDDHELPLVDSRLFRIRRSTLLQTGDLQRQLDLLDSKDYRNKLADTMEDHGRDCVAQYSWQESSSPTCNTVMEVDVVNSLIRYAHQHHHYNNNSSSSEDVSSPNAIMDSSDMMSSTSTTLKFLANGYWRDVWQLTDHQINEGWDTTATTATATTGFNFVFKTQRYEHAFVDRNFDRHRRDAVAMERLTASPFIMDIYGFCGTSGVFEFADGGSLDGALWSTGGGGSDGDTVEPWNSMERLVVAYQVAAALAAVHNYPKEGTAAMAHTDIALGQYVYVQEAGSFKLQDFNRARFLAWNNKTNTPCTYQVGNNPGPVRIC